MSISHTCPACGSQLARIRAVPDAVYGLPVVPCSCGFAAVRRPHPMVVQWRSSIATARALAALAIQLFFAFVLPLSTAGFVSAVQRELADLRHTPWTFAAALIRGDRRAQDWFYHDGGIIMFGVFTVLSVAGGAWLRATLGHWKWPRPMFAWTAVVAAWLWFELLVWPVQWLEAQAFGGTGAYSGPGLRISSHLALVLAASFALSFAGVPLGRGLIHIARGSRRSRFIKMLRRRRAGRRGE